MGKFEKNIFIRSNQDEESDGIIPRSVKDIFRYIQDTTSKQFVVKVELFRYPELRTLERERERYNIFESGPI